MWVFNLVWAWVFAIAGVVGLLMLMRKLIDLNERRERFASAVTHELRTPVSTLSLYAEMLEQGMVPESKRPGYYAVLAKETGRLTHLIENVLVYARMSKTNTPVEIGEGYLRELISPLYERLKDHGEREGVQMIFVEEDGLADIRLFLDRVSLDQILSNLLDNTIKYAEVPSPEFRIELRRDGEWLEFMVSDNGRGIDPEILPCVFEPFSRSAEYSAGKKPGVGLGLALSRDLARLSGGDVELIRSGEGGTCFRVRFPYRVFA